MDSHLKKAKIHLKTLKVFCLWCTGFQNTSFKSDNWHIVKCTGMKKKLLKCLKNQFFPYIHQVDESAVEVLHIVSGPDSMARNSHVDSYRYPKAGIADCFSDLS